MLHMTTPLLCFCSLAITNVHALSISRMLDLLACIYIQLSIVEESSSSIFQVNFQPANTIANAIANAKPSATVAQAVLWYSINSPPHMQPHKPHPIAKIEGVAFLFSHSQSGLYSTICNRLTMHSKPDLRYTMH